MSFLEMTKLHLTWQEKARSVSGIRTSDGHFMRRIIWKSEKATIFQDPEGHFWRFLHDFQRSAPVVIKAKSN